MCSIELAIYRTQIAIDFECHNNYAFCVHRNGFLMMRHGVCTLGTGRTTNSLQCLTYYCTQPLPPPNSHYALTLRFGTSIYSNITVRGILLKQSIAQIVPYQL